jgi:hypothetical protein
MKPIPNTEHSPVLRTDFSDQTAWEKIRNEIQRPVGFFRFVAYVDFIDDIQYADLSRDHLLNLISPTYNHSFIIVADRTAISSTEHPLLVIDLFDDAHPEFRALPSQVQGIENNLSIGNMGFEDFTNTLDGDGVFRGFRRY